jgi:hypothetical protein
MKFAARRVPAAVWPLALIGGVSTADAVAPRVDLAPMLMGGPLLAGLVLPPRRVALMGALTAVLVLPLSAIDRIAGTPSEGWIAAGVVVASVLALWLSQDGLHIQPAPERHQPRADVAPVAIPIENVAYEDGASELVTDVLHRVLLGRPASAAELASARRQALDVNGFVNLARELKSSGEGARVTMHGVAPALRTYVRPRFDARTGRSETSRLVFLHVMKVGGTSLSDLFARWLDPEDAWVHLYVDDLALTPPPILATLRLIAGHIPFAALPLIPPPFTTLLVLRDPLSRTLSHYLSLVASEPAYAELTLDSFVFGDSFEALSGNYQARQLAHDKDLVDAWRSYSPEQRVAATGSDPSLSHPITALFDSGPLGLSDDELLRTATGNLEQIDLVGTTDDLGRVAVLAADLFGVQRKSVTVPHLNVSRPFDRSQLSAQTRRRIEEKTAVDQELYRLARLRADGEG